ncbi:MAG: flagellar biosynthesis regulator FlaF [Ahrensia sp.]|nr:flagellar biosynthesis regulator FlaF [Ahrensia sp.]
MIDMHYESVTDSSTHAREIERKALAHSVELLKKAMSENRKPADVIEAAYFTRSLWTAFIRDLGSEDNALSKDLRAQLISIGVRMIDCSEKLRNGDISTAEEMIDVSEIISGGLVE